MKTGIKNSILALGVVGIFTGFTAITSAGYFNTTPISSCGISITNSLQIGSENADVYTLQQFLSRAGYLYANPNGHFGPATKLAVKTFQYENYLSVTGIVNSSTRDAINERLCDTDVHADNNSYSSYGNSSGTTYVDPYDPYVRVISPTVTTPVVYSTPQSNISTSYGNTNPVYIPSTTSTAYNPSTPITTPATAQIQSTNIIYSPSIGYTYGIVPQTGSLTISTPLANTTYNEGDTVYLSWTTSNINASGYNILLENTSTGQSKSVGFTSNNNTSFVLTKETLDAVCAGACDNSQQGSFRIVITTPVTDIAGKTSTFRAAISPITIKRPYSIVAAVTMTASKTPVNSGEEFRVYVNIPSVNSWNTSISGNMVIKLHATCINNVQVSIAGVPCGQDFSMPVSTMISQQGIPVMITNTTWYSQDILFEANVFDITGKVIGTTTTKVTASPAPFHW